MTVEAEIRERFEDVTVLALKVEEEAMSQGMQVALKLYERPGNGFSPKASRRNAAVPIP